LKAAFSTEGPAPLLDRDKVEDFTRQDVGDLVQFAAVSRAGYRFEK
jgi:hypothetical protein